MTQGSDFSNDGLVEIYERAKKRFGSGCSDSCVDGLLAWHPPSHRNTAGPG